MAGAYRSADATVAAFSVAAVTPNNSTVLNTTRSLYVGGAGDISVVMQDGTTAVFSGVAAGTILPLQVTKVMSTSTTATLILALW